jgi:hypothetical protein
MSTATAKPPKKTAPAPSFDDREICEDHSNWLHQALGLQQFDVLPANLVDKYWELKRIGDRSTMILTQREIALMCWLLGYGKPTAREKLPPTVVELYRKGQIKKEDTVQVKYRDVWMPGVLKDVTANDELVVQPVGEADERRFANDLDQVKPAVAA